MGSQDIAPTDRTCFGQWQQSRRGSNLLAKAMRSHGSWESSDSIKNIMKNLMKVEETEADRLDQNPPGCKEIKWKNKSHQGVKQ